MRAALPRRCRWCRVRLAATVRPGQPDTANAAATIESIAQAVAMAQAGAARGVVTNPIAKSVLQDAGFAHPGHTEFLAELTGGCAGREVMMLASPMLRVVPVTIHVSLRGALDALSMEAIVAAARTTAAALSRDFGGGAATAGDCRAQSACRREWAYWAGGDHDHSAGDGDFTGRGFGCERALAAGYDVHADGAAGV